MKLYNSAYNLQNRLSIKLTDNGLFFAALYMTISIVAVLLPVSAVAADETFTWESKPPADCPFKLSTDITGIAFTPRHAEYTCADTWYPSWASDGNLYSPWTDGTVDSLSSQSGWQNPATATTGQAKITGDDPLHLQVTGLGATSGPAAPYSGRYPCGSLVHNGIWYYGTYCLAPNSTVEKDGINFNWPWLGPFVGFRISRDFGLTWEDTPCTPSRPLFGEWGLDGNPVKIGSPHFVDFGKNMENSPDGKAYLVGHGAVMPDSKPRFANLSWITGDQIYLIRVIPSIENMNDRTKYEFFAGNNRNGKPVWSKNFSDIKPLVEWNNRCGCVTMTYNKPLGKYMMCITDGWPTTGTMDTFILESDAITGPWKLVTYMEKFGEQGYFVNIPSKFISSDGRTAWLSFSGNFSGKPRVNPEGSRYGWCLHEIKLLDRVK